MSRTFLANRVIAQNRHAPILLCGENSVWSNLRRSEFEIRKIQSLRARLASRAKPRGRILGQAFPLQTGETISLKDDRIEATFENRSLQALLAHSPEPLWKSAQNLGHFKTFEFFEISNFTPAPSIPNARKRQRDRMDTIWTPDPIPTPETAHRTAAKYLQ